MWKGERKESVILMLPPRSGEDFMGRNCLKRRIPSFKWNFIASKIMSGHFITIV